MNYDQRLKRLEAQAQPQEPRNLRIIYSAVKADGAGGWAGVEIWKREGERVFHERLSGETITKCLARALEGSTHEIRIEIVPEDPRWLTPEEYRKSGRTDLWLFDEAVR